VFLDEIGEMPLALQAKLLRVLENRTLVRLGSVQERTVDVRVVAATNRDLLEEAKAGRFRLDLYYRLSVAEVRLPPLRARPRELPLLAEEFLAQASATLGRRPPPVLAEGALLRLRAHDWPGNVRELRNLVDYLATTVPEDTITAEHVAARLDERARAAAGGAAGAGALPDVGVRPLAEASRDFERRSIEAALAATKGNKTRAAKLLGVPLRTFMEKVKRHGLA
jgi:DNA-binding NtrC family response regulator